MSLRKALLAATVLSLPLAAQAQPVSGLYVGAGVGANFRHDATDSGFKATTTDVGWVGLGSIGWGFGNGLRAEIEGNYRHNDVDSVRINGVRAAGRSGYLRTYGVMANVLYDFNGLGWPVTPYVGAGVGYAWSAVDNMRGQIGNTRFRLNDDEGVFAYQAIVGLSYSLGSMVPGLALTTEYRFFGTMEPKLTGAVQVGNAPAVAARVEPTNYNHSVLVGLRYNFGVAPAPVVQPQPQVQPPPQVARTYLVFFDWDRADLTARAREIIAEAARNSKTVAATRIEVAGHADRSGTPQYNQRLSQRRADAVAAELVRNGVSRNDITVTAFGESRPLVPTADGVREPQNRRVEIVLR